MLVAVEAVSAQVEGWGNWEQESSKVTRAGQYREPEVCGGGTRAREAAPAEGQP